ncbi:MAG: hypothetical protein NZ742_10745, partial [Acidobacteria bacterium]|nr:hypothetical protein [Acidobacteriota bacterium]MDW7985191.1 hypothetical protein [Acidobacteriota bacterium]
MNGKILRSVTGWAILLSVSLSPTPCSIVNDPTGQSDPPAVPCLSGHETLYDRYEGTGVANACRSDADCVVSGCSREVCAAESVVTTCEAIPTPTRDLS